MPVNALDSLIRTCAAESPSEAKDVQEAPVPRKCAPIASLGFWAQSEVPLSMGISALKHDAKNQESASLAAVALPSIPLEEELKVRDRLAMAKEMAEVGDDIRWDVIIEEASRMPCAVNVNSHASGLKKAPLTDDDENRSTSASGSGGAETDETEPELEATSNDETGDSGKDTPPATPDAKLPPWRRTRASTTDSGDQESRTAVAAPPWRRGGNKNLAASTKSEGSTRVYSIATMLQCWMLMQQTPTAIVEAECQEDNCHESEEAQEQKSAPPPPPGFASKASPAGAARDAPWRRRPQASS